MDVTEWDTSGVRARRTAYRTLLQGASNGLMTSVQRQDRHGDGMLLAIMVVIVSRSLEKLPTTRYDRGMAKRGDKEPAWVSNLNADMKLLMEESREARAEARADRKRFEKHLERAQKRLERAEERTLKYLKRSDEKFGRYVKEAERREKDLSQALVIIGKIGRAMLKSLKSIEANFNGRGGKGGRNGNGRRR